MNINFLHCCLHWQPQGAPRHRIAGDGGESQRTGKCHEEMGETPIFILFLSVLEMCMLHCAPLLRVENVCGPFMADAWLPSSLCLVQALWLTAVPSPSQLLAHPLLLLRALPLAPTRRYFSASCGCLTFPLQREHLGTHTSYSSSVFVTVPRTSEEVVGIGLLNFYFLNHLTKLTSLKFC